MVNGVRRQVVATTLCLLTATPLSVLAQREIRCESRDYRYRYCRVDTHYRVRLTRQRSSTWCRHGYNWGYDRRGIWVDRGCAADFEVDDYYGGDWGDDNRGGGSTGKGIAIGAGAAVAGIAIAAAIAANRNNADDKVPSWAIGTFRGYDPQENATVELTIAPGGAVTGMTGGQQFDGVLNDKKLEVGQHKFKLDKQGNGFLAIDETDKNHQVLFSPVAGGGRN